MLVGYGVIKIQAKIFATEKRIYSNAKIKFYMQKKTVAYIKQYLENKIIFWNISENL